METQNKYTPVSEVKIGDIYTTDCGWVDDPLSDGDKNKYFIISDTGVTGDSVSVVFLNSGYRNRFMKNSSVGRSLIKANLTETLQKIEPSAVKVGDVVLSYITTENHEYFHSYHNVEEHGLVFTVLRIEGDIVHGAYIKNGSKISFHINSAVAENLYLIELKKEKPVYYTKYDDLREGQAFEGRSLGRNFDWIILSKKAPEDGSFEYHQFTEPDGNTFGMGTKSVNAGRLQLLSNFDIAKMEPAVETINKGDTFKLIKGVWADTVDMHGDTFAIDDENTNSDEIRIKFPNGTTMNITKTSKVRITMQLVSRAVKPVGITEITSSDVPCTNPYEIDRSFIQDKPALVEGVYGDMEIDEDQDVKFNWLTCSEEVERAIAQLREVLKVYKANGK